MTDEGFNDPVLPRYAGHFRRPSYWMLDDRGEPIPVPNDDSMAWSKWFEANSEARIVKKDVIVIDGPAWLAPKSVMISTVFLSLDHGFIGDGPPILWETMVCWPDDRGWNEQDRCSGSRADAMAMHERMLAEVRARWNN